LSSRSRRGRPTALRRALATAQQQDQRWFSRQAESHSPIADAVLPRLTRAADHSVLWMGLAALLTRTGGRTGRRAAARGLASIAVASLLANQVGKRALPRARPLLEPVPLGRRARRVPRSPSFPSGHSASAAAFAVGAASEVPWLAVPLGLTATAVCWSRVYTGVHYPSDVLAGAALGVGSALILARVVPLSTVRSQDPPAVVSLAARPTGRGVVGVVNQSAGLKGRRKHLDQIRTALPEAEIIEATAENLTETLRKAATRAEVLAISGGDGSVNAAATIAHEKDLPLAVLPGGTLDHFTADLGVRSVADTLHAIQTGAAVKAQVGRVTGADGERTIFLNTASIGSYPEFVRLRQRREGTLGKPIAAVLAMRTVLRTYLPEDVLIDGESHRIGMLFIGNGRYEPRGYAPDWRPSMNDGRLDLRLLDARRILPRARLFLDLLLGRVSSSEHYVERLGSQLRIQRSAGGLLARDGEIAEASADLLLDVDPRPLTVFRPLG
jgi:diacylglycerol kinase family enzyme/membrane-associated phospholipid phosphatase